MCSTYATSPIFKRSDTSVYENVWKTTSCGRQKVLAVFESFPSLAFSITSFLMPYLIFAQFQGWWSSYLQQEFQLITTWEPEKLAWELLDE